MMKGKAAESETLRGRPSVARLQRGPACPGQWQFYCFVPKRTRGANGLLRLRTQLIIRGVIEAPSRYFLVSVALGSSAFPAPFGYVRTRHSSYNALSERVGNFAFVAWRSPPLRHRRVKRVAVPIRSFQMAFSRASFVFRPMFMIRGHSRRSRECSRRNLRVFTEIKSVELNVEVADFRESPPLWADVT